MQRSKPDYNPAVANSLEVLQYLDDKSTTTSESSLLVFDVVFQGDLFDGSAAWAGGYQYRRIDLETQLDDLINGAINPCKFEGQTGCSARTGLRSFLASGTEIDADQDVHSLFFEGFETSAKTSMCSWLCDMRTMVIRQPSTLRWRRDMLLTTG